MLGKTIKSFVDAINGVRTVLNEERNFRIEILAMLLVTFCVVYFKFSFIESTFCVVAIVIVLCAEMLNTAVEDLCNKVEPNYDSVIGKIKDIMGGFVLLSSVGAFVIGVLVFWHHFM